MTKRLLLAAALFVLIAAPVHADFRDVARALSARHDLRRIPIPFFGMVRLALWVVAPQGVHDFQLAVYEGRGARIEHDELRRLLATKAGAGYRPIVQVHSKRANEWVYILARPHARDRVEMLMLVHDRRDTVLLRAEVDVETFAREVNGGRGLVQLAQR